MTYYIPIPTGKDQIYYNVCNKGPNILQSLQPRYNCILILTGKDQIFCNAYNKGPNILQSLQQILCNLIVY
jgi:trehalose-6-phosphatase